MPEDQTESLSAAALNCVKAISSDSILTPASDLFPAQDDTLCLFFEEEEESKPADAAVGPKCEENECKILQEKRVTFNSDVLICKTFSPKDL